MKGFNVFKWIFVVFTPVIIISFLFWFKQTKKPLQVYILDKTVIDQKYTEHKSLNWILNNNRIVKDNGNPYCIDKDYYGFFPLKKSGSKEYTTKKLRLSEILSISDDLDLVYFIDAYGVSYEDWYNTPPDKLHSNLIYGGLDQYDYLLLNEMKRKNKLVITEFNMLGSPTSDLIRTKIENLYDFYWTGWTGCYYKSLSIANPNLPQWMAKLYEQKSKKKWNFEGQGIVLVNQIGEIIVLQNDIHLNYPAPRIISSKYGRDTYKLPEYQNYSFWFDIITPGKNNTVVANYNLDLTPEGKKILNNALIPSNFPAIIEHLGGYKFYYFAGDFSDRNLIYSSSYFKGVSSLANIFSLKNSNSKNAFFWRFYLPLVENIIKNNTN